MKLTILEQEEKRRRDPHYRLEIEFMHGDADGYDTEEIEFDDTEEGRERLKSVLYAVGVCNHIYTHGRGGNDEHTHIPEFLAFFREWSPEELEDADTTEEEIKKLNPFEIYFDMPTDGSWGLTASFDGFSLYFVDENGDEREVEVEWEENELKRFIEVKTT